MVDNDAGDNVEPKPAKKEAFGEGSGDAWLRITLCIFLSDSLKCNHYLSVIV